MIHIFNQIHTQKKEYIKELPTILYILSPIPTFPLSPKITQEQEKEKIQRMRLTNEEILTQFPSWANHPSGNIQQVRYGDIPDCQYTQDS